MTSVVFASGINVIKSNINLEIILKVEENLKKEAMPVTKMYIKPLKTPPR